MAAKKAPDSQGNDGLFRLIAVVTCLSFLWKLIGPYVLRFLKFWYRYSRQIYPCLVSIGIVLLLLGIGAAWNKRLKRKARISVLDPDENSIFLGIDVDTKKEIYIKEPYRTMHTQVIGTTNAGKTASVIMPWAVQDIDAGRGLLIVDGKSDKKFMDKLYSHVVQSGRQRDFVVFSLCQPNISSTFNPFCSGSADQIAERIFSSFKFTDEYYKSVQFSALRTIIALIKHRGDTPMPGVIRELLRNKSLLKGWTEGLKDEDLKNDVAHILSEPNDEFSKKYSGLVTALGHFSQGETAKLYNTRRPEIDLFECLKNQKIVYFQLPTMQYPFLGEATGKLLLQSLQSAVSEVQVHGGRLKSLFSVYLDDFNDYIYPGFVSLLNKSRSANVGVVFSHQSLGDLEKVSPDFKEVVLTNTNLKVIMRSNDPASAEHFAKTIGTVSGEKTTSRRKKTFLSKTDTGEQSVRDAEEYIFHPQVFKSELGLGEGVVIIPHPFGRAVKRVKFRMVEDLTPLNLPIRDLPILNISKEAQFQGHAAPQHSSPK